MPMNPPLFDTSDFSAATPLHIQIMQRIRKAIVTGAIAPDASLPSERALAEIFGVSRVPVREALKILEFLGAAVKVRGKGLVVARTVDLANMLEMIDFVVDDPLKTLTDLFEVREVLESEAAGLAARRRTQKDLDCIEKSLIQMEVEIKRNVPVSDASQEFHFAVIQAAHNDILCRMYDCLFNILEYSRSQSLKTYSRLPSVLSFHRTIYEHILAGDSTAASESMRSHMRAALSSLEMQLSGQAKNNQHTK